MRRILIFSTAYLPHIGGAEVAVKEITERIGDFQFDLITARMDRKIPSTEKMGNINVYRVGFGFKTLDKFILPFLGCLKAAGLHKEGPYAITWSIMASQASIAAAFFKNKFPAVKLLLTLQEGDEEEHLKRYAFGSGFLYRVFIRPWHLLVFKRADYISAISNYLRQRALLYGIKAPVEIVPNGVDIKKFQAPISNFQKNEIKQKLGIKEGEKVIITASRLVEKNAVADIIDAMRYLQKSVKLLILGAGPLDKNLKLKTQDLKLQDRVIFFGKYDNDTLPSYLAISDVFVRPSLSEGQGISFLEAMAAGVPIIGTPVGGIPDFLKDPSTSSGQATGLFCEIRNPKSIAEKGETLLENNELHQKIIANAKKLVREEYNWDRIVVRMRNIFDKMMA